MTERRGVAGRMLLAAVATVLVTACGGRLAPIVVDASADASAGAPDDAASDVARDAAAADASTDAHSDARIDAPTDAPAEALPPDSGSDSGDACAPSDIGAPTPIAPLSTATATSQQPTLRWQLAPASDGAQVEICHDRACALPAMTFLAPGASGQPPTPLAAGVYFWRLHGTSNGCVGVGSSPVWEVFVGALSAPVDTSWGSVPDFDGDGVADAVTGSPGTDDAGGAAYVYKGGAQQLASVTTLAPPAGEPSPPDFGRTVAGAGDIDGDGFPEMLVSSGYDVWMFHGGAGGLSTEATVVVPPLPPMPEWRVYGVAGVGDVDGDGYGDVAVGTNNNVMIGGFVTIYRGGAAGLTASTTQLEIGDWGFGNALAGTDVNGDGYADILAFGTQGVYVFEGGPGGPRNTPVLIPVLQSEAQGYWVASAGDVNGDGYGDVLAVERPYSSAAYEGALLYYGSAAGPGTQPVVTSTPLGNGEGVGTVAGLGDVNGDGYADFVLTPAYDASTVYLALGGATGPVLVSSSWKLPMLASGAWVTLVGAGDVNGDGLDDMLVGAVGASASAVYLGDRTNDLQAAPSQMLPGGNSAL